MKNAFVAAMLLCFVFSFQSCVEDKCTELHTYFVYEPVYLTENELNSDFALLEPRDLKNPGKMYFYQNYIFINEMYTGVHIYDNSEPANPTNLGFISIPGNADLVVKDDILYAGGVLDIFSLNIADISNPTLVNTLEDIYPNVPFEEDRGFIAYYNLKEQVESYDCNNSLNWIDEGFIIFNAEGDGGFDANQGGGTIPSSGVPTNNTGVGGSTARMTISGDHIYLVDDRSLKSMDITNDGFPILTSDQNVGWGIETIYPYQDKLFIGSTSGMFIYDNSNPDMPVQLSRFDHWQACDPVVVEDNTAYVTLRDGTFCQGFSNQLDVIDITDIENPKLIESVEMTNPHGLAIRNNTLYICEGADGIKVFDASDDTAIDENLIHHDNSLHAVDVISLNENLLFVIGEDGFYQMDVSEKNNPQVISSILVVK